MIVLQFAWVLIKSAGITIWISWLALVIASILGGIVGYGRLAPWWPVRVLATIYTEFFRSLPTLVQLFFVYYGVSYLFRLDISPFAAAAIGLGLEASALMSEVVRSGLESVSKGQREAALSTGLRPLQAAMHVVWPQAIRVMMPSAVSIYVSTLKASSLASVIGYVELTKAGLLVRESVHGGPNGLLILVAVAVLYIVICYGISLMGSLLQQRYRYGY